LGIGIRRLLVVVIHIPLKVIAIFLVAQIIVLPQLLGQYYFRIKADFSVKEKTFEDTYRLLVGSVYYDMNYKKIVYHIQFPEKEIWVLTDTIAFVFKDNEPVKKQTAFIYPEFSIFNLVLQGALKDYGLKDHPVLKVKEIDRQGDKVIRTWEPTKDYKENLGKLKMSTKGRKLEAVVFYSPEGRLMSRQFFDNYLNVKGLDFPGEIVQFIYPNPEVQKEYSGKEMIVKTSYRNIQLNKTDEEFFYNYPLPVDRK
jgi:hypothetical protein